jgi:hypothetical protein
LRFGGAIIVSRLLLLLALLLALGATAPDAGEELASVARELLGGGLAYECRSATAAETSGQCDSIRLLIRFRFDLRYLWAVRWAVRPRAEVERVPLAWPRLMQREEREEVTGMMMSVKGKK